MINSKSDLIFYLKEDNKQYSGGVKWKDFILNNEKWYISRLKTELRHVEYYMNVGTGLLDKVLFLYHFFIYKHLCWKTKCIINPNTVGPGLTIWHLGSFSYIRKGSRIGKNFTMVCGVVLGRQKGDNKEYIVIGDDCYCGLNVTIIGDVRIGNNVKIGAHSVVTKNIEDNAVVAGVPARIIKYQDGKQ